MNFDTAKARVEELRNLIEYHRAKYYIKTLCGHLVITGQRLSLSRYDRDGLVVLGKIEKLSYRPKG